MGREEKARDSDVISQARRHWIETVDAISDPLMVHDARFRVVRCNRAYAARAQMSFQEIIGKPYWDCFPRRSGPLTGEEFTLETGEIFVCRRYELAGLDRLYVFADVTETRRIEERLRLANAVIESSSSVLYRAALGIDGAVRYVSSNVSRYGYAPEELTSGAVPYTHLVHPDDRASVAASFERHVASGASHFVLEYRIVARDGRTHAVEDHIVVEYDGRGQALYQEGVLHDVTERRAAEAKIRMLARFPEENPNAVMRVNAGGLLVYANQASGPVQRYCGAGIGQHVNPECADLVDRCLRAGKVFTGEMKHDGCTFSLTFVPLVADGYVNIYGVDITERRRAEEEIRVSRDLLQAVVEHAPLRVFWKDRSLRYLGCNSAFAQDAGMSGPEDLIGKDDFAMAWRGEAERYRADDAAVMESGKPKLAYEEPQSTPDGRTLWIRSSKVPLHDGDGTVFGVLGIYEDITTQKLAADALKRANRGLRTLSAGNEALVRARDESELLKTMCRILTEVGGYRIAFVGYALDDARHSVEPKAWSGVDDAFLRSQGISWGDDAKGRGAVGRAIREGRVHVIRDIAHCDADAQWRRVLGEKGIRTVIGIPLQLAPGAAPIGAIGIASDAEDVFDAEELRLLEELAGDLAYGIANLRSDAERRAGAEKLRRGLENTIGAIAATMDTRDPYTAGHQRRVAELAAAIAREMGLSAETVEGVHFGALIHDLGKIQIPAEILAKPTRLTSLEFELIKTHSQAGYDIVKGIDFPWPVARMVLQHHERLDGSGYPAGARGDAIALEARILAVADVVEAMASHRPYRPGLGVEAALKEIEEKRGRWFEPAAVDACLRLFREGRFSFATDKR